MKYVVLLCAMGIALPAAAIAALPPAPRTPSVPAKNPRVEHLLGEAQTALAAGNLKQALIDLKLAAGMEPNNPVVISQLGIALVQNGEFAKAEEELALARALGAPDAQVLAPLFVAMLTLGENQMVLDLFAAPDPANRSAVAATILRARATALLALRNAPAAVVAINRSLTIRRDFDALLTAAHIAQALKQFQAATALVDEALTLRPDSVDAANFKINLALQAGDKTNALLLADRLVTSQPQSMAARLERIKVYLDMGRLDQAKPEVDRILAQTPRMSIALYFRAIILARANKFAAAWAVAHQLQPEFIQADEEIAVNVAEVAAGAGYFDSAATILDAAVFKNPHLLEARLRLAEIRLRQNSPQYALNVLALVEDSKDPRVAVLLAQAYRKTGHWSEARKYIERAIALGGGEGLDVLGKDVALKSLLDWHRSHPDNLLVHKQYAILLLKFGDVANAKAEYELLVRKDPKDGLSLNNLAWLVLNDEPRRALELAQRAVATDPASANFLDTLGSLQLGQADHQGALASLQRAHALRPENPLFSYHLAQALEASGAHAAAVPLLKDAVARGGFPELDQARELLRNRR